MWPARTAASSPTPEHWRGGGRTKQRRAAATWQAAVPAALRAYEDLRRERVAAIQQGARQNGMRYDSSYADLGVRDAEIAAHAAFRKRLYDHDVVPEAKAVALALS